jgi:hypothetical protein
VETDGRVWIYKDNQLQPVRVRLGVTDGQTTELISGDLQPDAAVVTNIVSAADATKTATAAPAGNPFNGLGPGGGGNFNRGGANRGGR